LLAFEPSSNYLCYRTYGLKQHLSSKILDEGKATASP
jgi:hypothetical protein